MDSKGFDIIELNNGNSDVEFSYIVISKRIDAENKPVLPEDIANKDFDERMKGVMFNENYLEQTATPIWWDGKQVRFDAPPEQPRTEKKQDPELSHALQIKLNSVEAAKSEKMNIKSIEQIILQKENRLKNKSIEGNEKK